MSNDRGIVLPLTLILMVAIGSLTLGLLSLSAMEPRISRNLTDAAQARYAAEAGLESGYNTLLNNLNWSSFLTTANPSTGTQLAAASPIGTLNAYRGTYAVRVRNDNQAGDPAITGESPIETTHSVDTNGVVILTSTGSVGGATKTVRAALKRLVFPPGFFPGALNFPGNEAEITFNGNSFEVDGRGWSPSGTLDPGCGSASGIAVSTALPAASPGANEAVVEGALTGPQQDNVLGKAQNPALPGEGSNTIVGDATLTPDYIAKFVESAKAAADIVLESAGPDGLQYDSVGQTCAIDVNSPTCWGTAAAPKIVYVKGTPDPAALYTSLKMSGTTEGHGILIVENGDLAISGNFLWVGPIIVTGQYVGVSFLGGGYQTVYGAVVSNETATDPGITEGLVTGNAKIRYSCEGLAQSINSKKLVTFKNWKDLAPGE